MSYTLNVEPEVVREAESYAVRNGTTLEAMIRAYLLVIGIHGSLRSGVSSAGGAEAVGARTSCVKIGSMRDEINLPNEFDQEFNRLDGQVSALFEGVPS